MLILRLIKNYLKGLETPIHIETAKNGEQAWQLLEKNPEHYDICLLDRIMGDMDGIELLERMRGHWILREIPVILQTSKSSNEDIIEGMKAGAYYYLTKPLEKQLTLSVVSTALSDRLLHQGLKNKLKERDLSIQLLKHASFEYRTIEEAHSLASLLANVCPNPAQVVPGLAELLLNAVEHGNLGIGYNEKSQLRTELSLNTEIERRLNHPDYYDKYVNVEVISDVESVMFTIQDEGKGFDWEPYLDFGVNRMMDNHGRGIAIANQLCFDHIEYLGNGNTVIARAYKQRNRC